MTVAPKWHRPLVALGVAWLALLALFTRDTLHLVDLWWNASTYSHCLIILPVLGWLVWLRRAELAKLTPAPWLPGLGWIAIGAFAWLLGDAAGIALFRHAGLILMLQGCVPALLGPHIARGLAFPLFYSLFLIPFGDELVPPMQMLTADMAMGLLRLSGIPAHIDGIFITTPGGYFAVAEACSGVKFLVAMAALSVLTAHLCFTRWARRIAFVAFAMLTCILANGFRAFSTIWIAENWGTAFAAGADHIIYGWVFFGLVIAAVGAAAWPWFDREADAVGIDGDALARFAPRRSLPLFPAALAALLLAAAPVLWGQVSAASATPLPAFIAPDVTGYDTVPGPSADWQPHFTDPDQRSDARMIALTDGHSIDIAVIGYARQSEGRELVGFGQGAVDPDSEWDWGQSLAAIGPARVDRIAREGVSRDILTVYVVGGTVTSDPRTVKWRTLIARLTGGDQRAYALLLSAPGANGRARIAALVQAAGGVEALAYQLTKAHPQSGSP
jgi:exosortase A